MYMIYRKKNNNNSQRGFTILVAVITAGILLIIAMSIGGIALKEKILSASSKDSQIAFYAADTAMECALYWDQKKGVFTPDINGELPVSNESPITIRHTADRHVKPPIPQPEIVLIIVTTFITVAINIIIAKF